MYFLFLKQNSQSSDETLFKRKFYYTKCILKDFMGFRLTIWVNCFCLNNAVDFLELLSRMDELCNRMKKIPKFYMEIYVNF